MWWCIPKRLCLSAWNACVGFRDFACVCVCHTCRNVRERSWSCCVRVQFFNAACVCVFAHTLSKIHLLDRATGVNLCLRPHSLLLSGSSGSEFFAVFLCCCSLRLLYSISHVSSTFAASAPDSTWPLHCAASKAIFILDTR